jgi:hypothetical protein
MENPNNYYKFLAKLKVPVLKKYKNIYYLDAEYNQKEVLELSKNDSKFFNIDKFAAKGHDVVHIITSIYLDKILGVNNIGIGPVREMLDIGFGAGIIPQTRKDERYLFDDSEDKRMKWLYLNISDSIVRKFERENKCLMHTDDIQKIYKLNLSAFKMLLKLLDESLILGKLFKNTYPLKSSIFSLTYAQFSAWKDKYMSDIKNYNRKDYEDLEAYELYKQENIGNYEFEVEIGFEDFDTSPFEQQAKIINDLIAKYNENPLSFKIEKPKTI